MLAVVRRSDLGYDDRVLSRDSLGVNSLDADALRALRPSIRPPA
jgi:hypothetical protein